MDLVFIRDALFQLSYVPVCIQIASDISNINVRYQVSVLTGELRALLDLSAIRDAL